METTLPESVRDGFAALEDDAAGQAYRRGQVYATNLNFHDDQANFRLAHAIAAGERIVAVQHGGSYGWAGLLPLLAEMEYWHDVFVSWGWDTHDEYDGRFVPLPYPLLSRNLGGHQPATDEALLVGAAMYGFNPRTDYYTEPLRYRKKKRRFIAALPDELRTKLLYRPYYSPQLPVLDDLAYLKRHFPDLRAHEGQLLPSLLRAKLVVQDHHSTTLSITMSANIPTIGFWSEVDWPLGAQGKALFDRLERVGIVFDDPEDAARQVARVWPRVHEWWSGADVQAARRAWCRQFARASRLWPLHWMKGLGAIQLGLVP